MYRDLMLCAALALTATACNKAEEGADAPQSAEKAPEQPPKTAEKPAEKPAEEHAPDAAAAIEPVLVAYEAARKKLADDQVDVAAVAADLEKKAQAAAAKAGAEAKPRLQAVAAAAKKLGAAAGGDIEALRVTFGEVSEPLVALVAAHPKLAEGRHVFECPMAKGYQKWIQAEAEMANPYMGKKMLACGTKAEWK